MAKCFARGTLSAVSCNRVLAKQRSALHYIDELQLPVLMAQDVRRILVFQSFTQHVDDFPTQVPVTHSLLCFKKLGAISYLIGLYSW